MGWLDVLFNAAQYGGWGAGIGGGIGAAFAYLVPARLVPSMTCPGGFHEWTRIEWIEVRCDTTYDLASVYTPGLPAVGALIGAAIGWAVWSLVKSSRSKPEA